MLKPREDETTHDLDRMILERHSIRKFLPLEVPREAVEEALAQPSPPNSNIQLCRIEQARLVIEVRSGPTAHVEGPDLNQRPLGHESLRVAGSPLFSKRTYGSSLRSRSLGF
jgi:hypothetical protein